MNEELRDSPPVELTALLGMNKEEMTLARIEQLTGKTFSKPERDSAAARAAFITKDPAMLALRDYASLLADNNYTVLLTGETGTGKELLARILHGKREGKFCPINCAGLSDTLFESDLFGHKKGAATGLINDHAGVFKEAEDGTVFLDEVGELKAYQQAKLLRVLDTRKVGEYRIRGVGESEEKVVHTRVVAATHRDLNKMVEEGTFREDLYYRLAQFELHTTPLRERIDDVALIAEAIIAANDWSFFLKNNIPRWAYEKGNVRALFNYLLRYEHSDPVINARMLSSVTASA